MVYVTLAKKCRKIIYFAFFSFWLLEKTCVASTSLKQEILEQIFTYTLQEVSTIVDKYPEIKCFISRVMEDCDSGDKVERYLRKIKVQTVYDVNNWFCRS